MTRYLKRADLIYPDLCYQIIGILFDVWSKVGYGHRERVYQRGIAEAMRASDLRISEQSPAKLFYGDKPIGVYYFDFLIESRVVLEIKVREYFSTNDIKQLYAYLRAHNLKLGLLAHFTRSGVKFKRIVNLR